MEKIECQRQEEGAEVSQKLMTLEKEKKLAERKAADAKDRELEWQLKCQGLDQMKQVPVLFRVNMMHKCMRE